MLLQGRDDIDAALSMLSAALEARGIAGVELVVIGGAALNILGVVVRPTRDVDVLAICEGRDADGAPVLIKHKPLPASVASAALVVADALGLDPNWLNAGPADLLDWGMPAGFEQRLAALAYGANLVVHTPAREDLICLKVYAAADTGIGRHTEDLEALQADCDELLAGARWAHTQDPSEGFRTMLLGLLRHYGCHRIAEEFARED